MIHVVELVLLEQPREQLVIEDGALHELRTLGHLVPKPAAQVVEHHHLMPDLKAVLRHVRPDEPCTARYQ